MTAREWLLLALAIGWAGVAFIWWRVSVIANQRITRLQKSIDDMNIAFEVRNQQRDALIQRQSETIRKLSRWPRERDWN